MTKFATEQIKKFFNTGQWALKLIFIVVLCELGIVMGAMVGLAGELDENDSNTWAPIDLTGATVRLRMRAIGSSTVKSVLTMAISNALNGVVTTNFPTGTLDTAGTFEGEIEITYPTGGIQTLQDLIKFKIRKDFD